MNALSVANTNRDGTGTIVNCFTPGASGSIIDSVEGRFEVTSTAGMVRIFLSDDS